MKQLQNTPQLICISSQRFRTRKTHNKKNLVICKFFINLGFFAVVVMTLPIPDEHFITNPRLMINTRLFAIVLERLVLFPIKTPL